MIKIRDILSFLKIENALDLFSLLGTISIFIAALLISSKKSVKPKIRIYTFIAYIGACIFLGTWGLLMNSTDGDWLVIQQVFLFFINCRGIYNAVKEIKDERRKRSCITCKFRENGYLCENDEVVCGDKNKGWKPRTDSNRH